jgi:hypothetical protein
MSSSKRFMLLGLVIVSAFAAHLTTATADIHPAGVRVVTTSRNVQLVYSNVIIRCATATATFTTPASGVSSISPVLNFTNCTLAGLPATVTCDRIGLTTLRLTAFALGSGTGTIALDAGFTCTITSAAARCSVSIVGAQANVGTFDYTNARQELRVTATNVAGTDNGGQCAGNTATRSGRGTGAFTGTYTPDSRITVS